jgi:hypothetical protein
MAFFPERLQTTKELVTREGTAVAAGTATDPGGTSFIRVTSGSTLSGITGGLSGYELTLINATGADLTIANDTGGATGDRIVTGTGGDIALPDGAALYLKYSANLLSGDGAWQVVGGVAGGFKTSAVQSLSAAGTPTIGTQPFQRISVQGNAAAITMATALAGGTDGMTLLFVGEDSTNTVTIATTDTVNGFVLNGDVVLSKYGSVMVQYDATLQRWIEISRNQIASFV